MRYAPEKTCSTDETVALNPERIIDCKSSVGGRSLKKEMMYQESAAFVFLYYAFSSFWQYVHECLNQTFKNVFRSR